MGDFSEAQLHQIKDEVKSHEAQLKTLQENFMKEKSQLTKTVAELKTILQQNCIDGTGEHIWQPLMFYDYYCKKCGVHK